MGLPMQVEQTEERHAWVQGRGERRRVNTALLAPLAPGDWVLVFLDDARERISAQRAAEVNAVLDLVQAAMNGAPLPDAALDFELPSRLSAQQMRALAGGAQPS